MPCLSALVRITTIELPVTTGGGRRACGDGADPETSCLGGFSSTQPKAMNATPITKQASAKKRSNRPYRAARPVLRGIKEFYKLVACAGR